MKALPARELMSRIHLPSTVGRPLAPRTCGFGHEMEMRELGVWYCDHTNCGVLMVFFHYPQTYKYNNGAMNIYFDREEAADYLQGKQSVESLVQSRMEKVDREQES